MGTFQSRIVAAVVCVGIAWSCGCCRGPWRESAAPGSSVEKGIVVAPLESWRPSGGWGSVERRYTRNARIDTSGEHPRFVVDDADSLHVWLRSDVRVPISSYPIAVLTYRTENVVDDWYCIWVDDGTGPYNGCEVFEFSDLKADGKVHECRFDMRRERIAHTGRKKKLKENGTIGTMALGVRSKKAPAYVELIDLRFLPPK